MQEVQLDELILRRWLNDKMAYDIANFMGGGQAPEFYSLDKYKKELIKPKNEPLISEAEKAEIKRQAQKFKKRLEVTQ